MLDHFTRKEKRIIRREIQNIFSKRSLIYPNSHTEISNLDFPPLKVIVNECEVFISDTGKAAIQRITGIVYKKGVFDQLLSYEDIFKGLLDVIRDSLVLDKVPLVDSFVEELEELLDQKIQVFYFITRVHGLTLSESTNIEIGKRRIQHFNENMLPFISDQALSFVKSIKERFKNEIVIIGQEMGSNTIAQEKFHFNVELSLSVIRLYACATYKQSIHRVNIGSDWSNIPKNTQGSRITIRWQDSSEFIGMTDGSSGRFSLKESEILSFVGISCCLSSLIDKKDKTDLEDKLIKSLFWFGEGQKDHVYASAWVKLWSSLECFFTIDGEQISEDNASGIASILLCSSNNTHERLPGYADLKLDVKKYYKMRSKIVHHSNYIHIDKISLEEFSYIVSWTLIEIALLVEKGVVFVEQLHKIIKINREKLESSI